MRIVLLGTSGYHPTEDRQTACVLLPDLGIVLDAGTGMFRVGKRLNTDHLDILLSHAHLDHVVGLTYFFTLLHEHPLKGITIHGEEEKLAAIREHLFSAHLFPAEAPFTWKPLQPRRFLSGSQTEVSCFPLKHPGNSVGFRLSFGGKSMAYVTDTTAEFDAAYVDEIRDVDLLIHECNFPNGQRELAQKTGHSCLDDVAQVACQANAKRLVLTHFDPMLEISAEQVAGARQIFPNLELGTDHLEIQL